MNIVIIEDDPIAKDILVDILASIKKELKIDACCSTLRAGKSAIKKYQPTILFLDIELPDGKGIDMLDEIDERYKFEKFPNLLIKPVRQGYYMLQSNFDMANQDLASAEANIRKSLANKSDMLGTSQEGISYLQLGGISLQKGDNKEALKNLKLAVQKGLPDDDNLGTAYLQICTIYAQRREIKVAKEYLRRANALKIKNEELKKQLKEVNKQMARA